MPSLISHTVVGLTAAVAVNRKFPVKGLAIAAVLCSLLPDADVIGFSFGVKYADFLGHRGFFHSIFFATLLGFVMAVPLTLIKNTSGWRWLGVSLFLGLVGSMHGILDAMTSGGLGIALLSPFDETRYFLPWTPIKVSPFGIKEFFSEWGVKVIKSESFYIWLPAAALYTASLLIIRKRTPQLACKDLGFKGKTTPTE